MRLLAFLLACGSDPDPVAVPATPVPTTPVAPAPVPAEPGPGVATGAPEASGVEAWEAFERDERWGYRDATGAERIAPRFRHAAAFTAGVTWAADDTGLVWIDRTGAVVAKAYNYDNGGDEFSQGLARFVGADGRVGFLDATGAIVIPARWTFAAPFSDGRAVVCEGCAPASADEHAQLVGGRWGAIDRAGALVVPLDHASWEAAAAAAGN